MPDTRLSALDSILQDLRYTFRTLRRDPGFTAFAILIVGLGIGASATVFSVVDALLLRPLPFHEPERLVWIANHDTSGLSGQTTQVGHLLDLREHNHSFSDLAGYFAFYGVGDNILSGQGEPERLSGVPVSENFFQVLGRPAAARQAVYRGGMQMARAQGRAAEPRSVGPAVRLRSRQSSAARSPSTMSRSPWSACCRLRSISPRSSPPAATSICIFRFRSAMRPTAGAIPWRSIGRLKPGVAIGSAQAEVRILAEQITRAHPERNDFEGKLTPLAEHVSGRMRPALLVLACAVGVVMLIVCANLSNLLLARTATRQKEIAIRTALGAGRRRLIRQMLTEGIALSCCGAALGVILATGGTRVLAHLEALSIPLLANVRTDVTALAFCLLAAVLTGVVFGLAPALQVPATALHDVLKDTTRGSTAGKSRNWIRGALVVSEIAFACVLLVGAGLLVRSFLRVLDVNLGFRPEHAATVRVDPDRSYSTQAQQNAYFDEVLRRVRAIPGVEAAGIDRCAPAGPQSQLGRAREGAGLPAGEVPRRVCARGERWLSEGHGNPADRRARYFGTRYALGRARDRDQRDHGAHAVARPERHRPDHAALAASGASWAWSATCATSRWSRARAWRCTCPCGNAAISLPWTWWSAPTLPPAELAASVRAALKPIAPNLPGKGLPDPAATGG